VLFKKQPVFISAQLHRGIAVSGVLINYAVWESASHFKNAANNAGIQARISEYPPGIPISPHIFKKVAVPGICIE
jgi:hypothetical protein